MVRSWLCAGLILSMAGTGAGAPRTFMVPMRDGTRLAPDVYLVSDTSAQSPTVLMRTPYNRRAGWAARLAQAQNAQGYVFVVQDTRGKFESEGADSVFLTDGVGPNRDGYDTIEWIVRQRWSNGKIGMTGDSAPGITAYLAAGTGHPALVCAVVGYAAASVYHDLSFPGGVFREGMVRAWMDAHADPGLVDATYARSRYDAAWERINLVAHAEDAHAAIYHWGGWFDIANNGTVSAFKALQERGGEGAQGRQMLVMGPWTHGNTGKQQGELTFPANVEEVNYQREGAAWLAHHLTGKANPLAEAPPVRFYLMGDVDDPVAPGNRWMNALTWPPPGVVETSFFLRQGGLLSLDAPSHEEPPDAYEYDPDDPAPTRGGATIKREGVQGPYDQREIEARRDVLAYSTSVLSAPVAVAGNIRVRLWASSSAEDTDFIAKLCDVYPDGRSMLILEGAICARFRESFADESFLTPGRTYEFDINLWNTAIVFNTGHRIRLSITSSGAPKYRPNRNTRTPLGVEAGRVVATNTVYHDSVRPSFLLLPLFRPQASE